MKMMSENFSKCPKGLSQNLTIGRNLKFPAKTLYMVSFAFAHPIIFPSIFYNFQGVR
jgi:hypothetical protein